MHKVVRLIGLSILQLLYLTWIEISAMFNPVLLDSISFSINKTRESSDPGTEICFPVEILRSILSIQSYKLRDKCVVNVRNGEQITQFGLKPA